jgi:ribonuclease D
MKTNSGLLSTAEEISDLAQKLKGSEVIAFDTEFIRESTFFPIVEIIQVATETESWLVDAQAFKKNHRADDPTAFDPGIQPLLEVFADPQILKFVHAAQGDQECLYTSFGVVAKPTLDTAVAASLCGYGDGIGLGKLLKMVLDITVTKGHARTNWSVRPLPEQLIEYAHADVIHLVKLGNSLLERLDEIGRKRWALDLSAHFENKALYQSNSEELTQKMARGGRLDKRGYAALRELVKWREERVRQLNLPRRWVADDQVLVDLAHVRPKDLSHLSTFRGLNRGELKNNGEAILSALNRAQEAEDLAVPKFAKQPIPSADETQVLDLLRCYVGILADRYRIAAKHLMTTSKLLPLLRSKIENAEDLFQEGILSEEAARLIGSELIDFVQGKKALVIKNNQVEIVLVDQEKK